MQEKEKSAHDMTDEEVAKSVDLETSDFDDSGDMLDELRDILDGKRMSYLVMTRQQLLSKLIKKLSKIIGPGDLKN